MKNKKMTENEKSGYKIMDSSLGVMFFDKDGNKKIVMENKYYTPELEEFHVGFEFESNYILFRKGNKGDEWNKHILTKENTWFWDAYENDAIETEFRVKYLDTEDIESLGFNQRPIDLDGKPNVMYTKPLENKIKNFDIVDIVHNPISKWVLITIGDHQSPWSVWETTFAGTIKNKSELKKLLKQLGI